MSGTEGGPGEMDSAKASEDTKVVDSTGEGEVGGLGGSTRGRGGGRRYSTRGKG